MDAVDGFTLRVEQNGQGPVVWIRGELDIAAAALLRDCLNDYNGHRVTVDFSDVTFLDSGGLAVLTERHVKVGADSLVLRGVQPDQMKILEITSLDELLNFEE
jgi:anti-anti-sigma factor